MNPNDPMHPERSHHPPRRERPRPRPRALGGAPLLALALALPTVALAQSAGAPPDLEAAMRQAMESAAKNRHAAAQERPEIIDLKESDVTGFIGAIKELKLLEPSGRGLGNSPQEFARGAAADSRVQAILQRNGLSAERLPQVAYSISLALASSQTSKAEIDEARASTDDALARMKERLTPEQYAMMKEQMGVFDQSIQQLTTQPKGNLSLVEKYRSQLEAAME